MSVNLQTDERPGLTSLVTGIINDAQTLFGQQFELFQQEVKEDLRRTKDAAIPLVSGLLIAYLGLILLAVMVAQLLCWIWPALPQWSGFAIVGGGLAVLGVGLALWGKKQFDAFNPLPDKTFAALKENVQWITKPK